MSPSCGGCTENKSLLLLKELPLWLKQLRPVLWKGVIKASDLDKHCHACHTGNTHDCAVQLPSQQCAT